MNGRRARATELISFRLTSEEVRILREHCRDRDESLHLVARDLLTQRLRNRELEDIRIELEHERALLQEMRDLLEALTQALKELDKRPR